MLAILLWTIGIALGIYLIGFFLFTGLLMMSFVGSNSSRSEIKGTLVWVLIWPYWVPRTIWYLWGNDLMMDA